ncbi:hypothetical protein GCM10009834_23620 [Streptomonospora arabica]
MVDGKDGKQSGESRKRRKAGGAGGTEKRAKLAKEWIRADPRRPDRPARSHCEKGAGRVRARRPPRTRMGAAAAAAPRRAVRRAPPDRSTAYVQGARDECESPALPRRMRSLAHTLPHRGIRALYAVGAGDGRRSVRPSVRIPRSPRNPPHGPVGGTGFSGVRDRSAGAAPAAPAPQRVRPARAAPPHPRPGFRDHGEDEQVAVLCRRSPTPKASRFAGSRAEGSKYERAARGT